MLERGKLLLVVIICTSVHDRVSGDVKLVDMSSNVVDDQYVGCREEAMEKVLRSGLLKQELNHSEGFQKAWGANTKCASVIPGGITEHTSALSALYFGDQGFMKELSNEVETMGANVSTYEDNFHFKSLHFLLMDSIMLLKQNKCRDAYAFFEGKKEPEVNSRLRFASFTLVESDLKSLGDLDGGTVLKMNSCFSVNLDEHICQKNIFKTLVSPAEVFTVEGRKTITTAEEEYTEVTLKHQAMNSSSNCLMLSRSAAVVSSRSFVPLLVACSLFSLYL